MIDHAQLAREALLMIDGGSLSAGKPVLLVGAESDRLAVLECVAREIQGQVANLNTALAQSLADAGGARADVAGMVASMEPVGMPLILDRIHILMLPQLKLNAIDTLCRVARRRPICVSWPGRLEGGRIKYASPNHPECLDEDASRVLVIDLMNNEGVR